MPATLSRRRLLARSAGLVAIGVPVGLIVRPAMAADYSFRQFHNQAASSPLHRRLVEMWTAIGAETNGRVVAEVFAENASLAGSDPAALKMLISGELDFFTLMGGILGQAVPVAEVQQVPFAFRTAAEAHAAADGALGAYLREEMAAKGGRPHRPIGRSRYRRTSKASGSACRPARCSPTPSGRWVPNRSRSTSTASMRR
jgi:TRAP-type C4-dicarboxylate transport system substrate-binding protein